jgi:hypothetical protein
MFCGRFELDRKRLFAIDNHRQSLGSPDSALSGP